MPNYYLFSPLMEDGGPVVRVPKINEWFDGLGVSPARPMDIPEWGRIKQAFPILVMHKFDHDPMGRIRDVFSRWNDKDARWLASIPGTQNPYKNVTEELWQAIEQTVKEWEGK